MPLIKVCGLTRIADLTLALRLGADYVGGIVEIARSPRCLSRHVAGRLLRCAAGRGVVVAETHDCAWLAEVAAECRAAAVQLHGACPPQLIARLRDALPPRAQVWSVTPMPVNVREATEGIERIIAQARDCADAGAAKVVLDAAVRGLSGGTGTPLNWDLAARVVARCPVPVLLAGGITPANARAALDATRAAGLDVSSGVEAAPGVKSPQHLRRLVAAVRGG